MAPVSLKIGSHKLVSFCPTVTASTTKRVSLRRFESRTNISHKQIIL